MEITPRTYPAIFTPEGQAWNRMTAELVVDADGFAVRVTDADGQWYTIVRRPAMLLATSPDFGTIVPERGGVGRGLYAVGMRGMITTTEDAVLAIGRLGAKVWQAGRRVDAGAVA